MELKEAVCAAWCQQGHGWQASQGGTYWTCRRVITVDGYGLAGSVIVEQLTASTSGGLEQDEPVIRWESDADPYSLAAAQLLAETLLRAADLVMEHAAAA